MPRLDIHSVVDARHLPPEEFRRSIFDALALLSPGQTMEVMSDKILSPLYRQLQIELPGDFGWFCLENGPATWRTAIKRLSSVRCYGHGCACCSGPQVSS